MAHSLMPSLSSRNKFWALALKIYAKTDIKIIRFYLALLDFYIFLKVFFTGLSIETNATLKLAQRFFNFQTFDFFVFSKFFWRQKKSTRPTCEKVPYLDVLFNSHLAFRVSSRSDFRKLSTYPCRHRNKRSIYVLCQRGYL